MRAELIGDFKSCMTEIYLHIDARMADYIRTHQQPSTVWRSFCGQGMWVRFTKCCQELQCWEDQRGGLLLVRHRCCRLESCPLHNPEEYVNQGHIGRVYRPSHGKAARCCGCDHW